MHRSPTKPLAGLDVLKFRPHAEIAIVLPHQVDAALGAACDYRARFSMECCDLDLSMGAGPKGEVEGTLRLWRLEAVEHIPAAPGAVAASATTLEEVCIDFCLLFCVRSSCHLVGSDLPCLRGESLRSLLNLPTPPGMSISCFGRIG